MTKPTVWRAARPPFLILAPVTLLPAIALAHAEGYVLSWTAIAWLLLGAVLAHVSVNALNEYQDFQSGLDQHTDRTPFSGGSGLLPAHPDLAGSVLALAIVSLVMAALIGLYFIWLVGWPILAIVLPALLLILGYTRWINRSPWLCLIAPGLGFGPLLMAGAYLVLTGTLSMPLLWLSLIPFFVNNNLLLLNQLPDIAADREAGRRHLPITLGARRALWASAGLFVGAGGVLIAGIGMGWLPPATGMTLLPLLGGLPVLRGLHRALPDNSAMTPWLGRNVLLTLATPILLAAGLWLSH